MTRARRIGMVFFTVIASASLILAMLEVSLRLFVPQPLGVSFRGAGATPVHTPDFEFHLVNPEFEVTTTFNGWGLRDRDYPREKPPRTFRILVLGDSITEALQVQDPEVYTEVLEASLNAVGSATHYEVINAGFSGFGTGDELRMLEHIGLELAPDAVLLQMSLINDLSENLFCRWFRVEGERVVPRFEPAEGPLVGFEDFLGRHLHLAQLIRHAFHVLFGESSRRLSGIAAHKERYHALLYSNQGSEGDFSEDWRVTLTYLAEMNRRLQERGIPLWVLIRPLDPDVAGYRDSDYPRSVLFPFLRERSIPYLDLTPIFAERSGGDIHTFRFREDSHWTATGHLWAAEALEEWLPVLSGPKTNRDD